MFKQIIIGIISVLENDRSYIARAFDKFYDIKNETEEKKLKGTKLAQKIFSKNENQEQENQDKTIEIQNTIQNSEIVASQNEQLAEALLLINEENKELLDDIKILRSLITNGLITTSILHDLMGINADLLGRVDDLKYEYEKNNKEIVYEYLDNMKRNDTFIHSWITVIVSQLKKQKRTKSENDIFAIVKNIELVLKPILEQKNIKLNIIGDYNIAKKQVYAIDIESIICNLIINSVEAFNKININNREININIYTKDEHVVITYNDNGPGISKSFVNQYDIFKYGVTDKRDNIDGEIIGTGLGMYLISTIVSEYGGKFALLSQENGFGLDIELPIRGK